MAEEKASSIVANSPEALTNSAGPEELRKDLEDRVKLEILSGLSLEDIRSLVHLVKNGIPPTMQTDYPDEFDEFGRNFRRMVHRIERAGASGDNYFDERPMASSLKEARESRPAADYFDPNEKVWILYGFKRQRDYVENTAGYMQTGAGEPVRR
jgi:hypothetical protein